MLIELRDMSIFTKKASITLQKTHPFIFQIEVNFFPNVRVRNKRIIQS